MLKTKSTYVPSAIFGSNTDSEEEILTALEALDQVLEVRFEEEGVPNHFTHDFFKVGQWAMLSPDVQMNHLYALAGICPYEGEAALIR